MEQLKDFIVNLSSRFRSENNLSDITWTMCRTSDLFQESFVHFFFPGLDTNEIFLQREYPDDDSRPDFFFHADGKDYLIECKIYDHNHHFEQYTKRFKIAPEQLGYITNYQMRKSGYTVRTWTELYFFLLKRIPEDESLLWEGYLDYLKDVCSIFITNRPMNLEGMFSLYTFYQCLDNVFAIDNERYSSEPYGGLKDTNNGGNFTRLTPRDGVIGKYFGVSLKISRMKKAWGWMGVYFKLENPIICVGFDNREGWGKPIYKLLNYYCDDLKEGKYFDTPYYDDESDAFWFDFNKADEFNSINEPKKQIELLKAFFIEILDTIYAIKQS